MGEFFVYTTNGREVIKVNAGAEILGSALKVIFTSIITMVC